MNSCLEATGFGNRHSTKLVAAEVVTSLRKPVPAAQFLDQNTCIGLAQKADDLLFCVVFFISNLLRWWDWTLNPGATQPWGDVALLAKLFLHIEADRGYWLEEIERLMGTVC